MSVVADAAALVAARCQVKPQVGIILGSGLGGVADQIEPDLVIRCSDIPGFPGSTVPGHKGELVLGTIEGVGVAALKGRVHMYEGHSPADVGFPVRFLHALGVGVLVVTNASGGLKPGLKTGTLMIIEDHINLPGLIGHNPLTGPEGGASRFVNMTPAYDPALRQIAREEAAALNLRVDSGVYVSVGGPSFETTAEARMLRGFGADAVGMSTTPEVIVARSLEMRVLGISCVTNVLLDPSETEGTHHEEVLSVAQSSAADLAALFRQVVRRLRD